MDIIDICNKIYNIYDMLKKIDKNLQGFLSKFSSEYDFIIYKEQKELNIEIERYEISFRLTNLATLIVFHDEVDQYDELTKEEELLYDIIKKVIKKNKHILKKEKLIELFSNFDKLRNLELDIILRVIDGIRLELKEGKIWIDTGKYIFDFLFMENIWINITIDKTFVARIVYNFKKERIEKTEFSEEVKKEDREKLVTDIIEILKSRFKTLRMNTDISYSLAYAIIEVNKLIHKTIFYIMCLKDIIDEVMKSNNPKLISLFI